jgi:hypothetical protein
MKYTIFWTLLITVSVIAGIGTGTAIKRRFNEIELRLRVLESQHQTPVPTNGGIHYYYHSTNLVERP